MHIQPTPTKTGFAKAVSRLAILFGIIMFLVAWPGFVSRAGAQSPSAPAPAVKSSLEHFGSTTAPVETPSEAMVADAAEYVRMFNVPLSEALRRLEAQEASVPLIDRLADGYRDRLAGIVIEHRPTFQIVIVVTGEAAPDTQVSLAPFGVPIILRSGALATRAAILAAIEAHQADLRAALPSPPGMGVDPRSGRLLVVARSGALDGDDDRTATSTVHEDVQHAVSVGLQPAHLTGRPNGRCVTRLDSCRLDVILRAQTRRRRDHAEDRPGTGTAAFRPLGRS